MGAWTLAQARGSLVQRQHIGIAVAVEAGRLGRVVPGPGRQNHHSGSHLVAQAGAGIVADSDPAAEYHETMDKAGALLASLQPGFDGAWVSS